MAQIKCVCISTKRKTSAQNIHQCQAALGGLSGDIHQGMGDRQVSMLPMDAVEAYFTKKGDPIQYGRFGENLVVEGLDREHLQEGDLLRAGTVLLKIVRLGAGGPKSDAYKGEKVCAPMEKHFIFCKILQEGLLQEGMDMAKEENR